MLFHMHNNGLLSSMSNTVVISKDTHMSKTQNTKLSGRDEVDLSVGAAMCVLSLYFR